MNRKSKNYRKRHESSEEEERTIIKKPKAETHTKRSTVNVLGVQYAGSGTGQTLSANLATRTLDLNEEEATIVSGDALEKLENHYTGLSNYKEFVNKPQPSAIRPGPLKSTGYVRISSRFDYAPDVCKDYKESGYCGFGDSCKFMHDRSDYKTGWQLDQEFEEQQRTKREAEDPDQYVIKEEELELEDSDDDLPFACLICRSDFKSPVVTVCKHYFCESVSRHNQCALLEFRKTPKCACCGGNTRGVFNVAKDLIAKLKDKQQRQEVAAAAIKEANKDYEVLDSDSE